MIARWPSSHFRRAITDNGGQGNADRKIFGADSGSSPRQPEKALTSGDLCIVAAVLCEPLSLGRCRDRPGTANIRRSDMSACEPVHLHVRIFSAPIFFRARIFSAQGTHLCDSSHIATTAARLLQGHGRAVGHRGRLAVVFSAESSAKMPESSKSGTCSPVPKNSAPMRQNAGSSRATSAISSSSASMKSWRASGWNSPSRPNARAGTNRRAVRQDLIR